ncbi:M14 family zinc carboxypeptidase [Litorilituus sediminis]|uniref:Peptidase M14 domain-containing protein n=1 Tax=Litorilituus sediminis TaxID=718192 RepID=A0A4P6PA20_9GAMM|nr:M14 family zinc carboxypeptidase [Litorilituus sediminis]QBG36425.1 hypothetical protein EMK97_12200 [Litorilituus sediminis]
MKLLRTLLLVGFLSSFSALNAAPVTNYLPENTQYSQQIPKPSSVLGFEVGQRQIRHEQLLSYFYQLAQHSDRIQLTTMGETAQHREQLLVSISSPENLKKLPNLLKPNNEKTALNTNKPLIVWLGYSVHGDEISGANAALVVAYHLAASQEQSMQELLANTIIVLEPSINPDGMDRFVNWVTTFGNTTNNPDANHIEHHQHWVTGRTNHYWFDLNRDWLLVTQQETQNRLKYFHQYKPHVVGDFHEMGHNSSYFFQPGILSRTHPLTPAENVSLTSDLAKFHAQALDQQDRLYYSEENFDDFYYGKGSTYPDINGSIGILFEQASSRGMQQQTVNGLLTFEDSIRNHVLTSLSTIAGAWHNKDKLLQYQHNFYQDAYKLAKKEKFTGYLLHEPKDNFRLQALLEKLAQHQINVYPLTEDFEHKDKVYGKDSSFYLPLAQPQYRLIKALFNQQTNFKDNTFYDVSGWTMPLAMNIEFQRLNRSWGLEIAKTPWQSSPQDKPSNIDQLSYAYAFEWQHFLAPKLLNTLLAQGIKAKVARKPFTSMINGQQKQFNSGTIIVLAGIQQATDWREKLVKASQQSNIELFNLATGLTVKGIDLGSSTFKLIKQPKVLMLGGQGISQYEAGEVRFYLDKMLNIPVSISNYNRLSSLDLSTYSHLILVNGNYDKLSEKDVTKIKGWIKQGGTIIGQKRGAKWLAKHEILAAKFASREQINQLFDEEGLTYQDKESLAARKRIAGAIFAAQLDTSHPLAYGYQERLLPLFRNSTLIMEQPKKAFITLAQYTPTPLLSGYTDQNLVNRLAHNAAIVAHNYGEGRVIATSDVLAFRGYWYGSAKILANSLFFAQAFSANTK